MNEVSGYAPGMHGELLALLTAVHGCLELVHGTRKCSLLNRIPPQRKYKECFQRCFRMSRKMGRMQKPFHSVQDYVAVGCSGLCERNKKMGGA